jgi:hypothetical protein
MELHNAVAAALDAFDGGATWYAHEFLAIARREEFAEVPERRFEEAAFQLCQNHRRDPAREWSGYFCPILTCIDDTGVERPKVAELIPDGAVQYWSERSEATPSQFLKARYADLVWDIGGKFGLLKLGKFAICARDAYVAIALAKGRFPDLIRRIAMERGLELASSLNHQESKSSIANLVAREGCVGDSMPFWAAFALLGHGAAPLVDIHAAEDLTCAMLDRVERGRECDEILMPAMLLDWMQRVIAFSNARHQPVADLRGPVESLIRDVRQRAPEMSALVAHHALTLARDLHRSVLGEAGIGEIDAAIFAAGRRAEAEMQGIEVPIEVPQRDIDRFLAWAISDDLVASLARVLLGSMPDRNGLDSLAPSCVGLIESLAGITTLTSDGRPGRTGGTEQVNTLREKRAMDVFLSVSHIFAHFGLQALGSQGRLTCDELSSALMQLSPPHMSDPHTNRAIARALLSREWVVATPLLVLRIEPLLVELAALVGGKQLVENAVGGLRVTGVDNLRDSPELREAMGGRVSLLVGYIFDSDGLRHSVAHGQRRDGHFREDDALSALQAVVGLCLAISYQRQLRSK